MLLHTLRLKSCVFVLYSSTLVLSCHEDTTVEVKRLELHSGKNSEAQTREVQNATLQLTEHDV